MAWVLVLIIELINSAIEAVVDRFGAERHELAGRAKDIGSAAVLIALINAGLVWLLVLVDRIWPEASRYAGNAFRWSMEFRNI